MLLTQGVMSAVSAGMLIYAGTVEMLAADFVFGSLGGQGHSAGAHGHSHGGEFFEDSSPSGSSSSLGPTGGHNAMAHGHHHKHDDADEGGSGGPSVGRKLLAVVSLLAGVIGMGLVGLGE